MCNGKLLNCSHQSAKFIGRRAARQIQFRSRRHVKKPDSVDGTGASIKIDPVLQKLAVLHYKKKLMHI
jgi:hypothetical protein